MSSSKETRLSSVGQGGRQRGVVLFIALVVMVAMALASIALIRSVDTGSMVAGNRAFSMGALQVTDIGVAEAKKRFDGSIPGLLSEENKTWQNKIDACYFATAFRMDLGDDAELGLDSQGVPNILKNLSYKGSSFKDAFPNCYLDESLVSALSGNEGTVIYYLIDRQCTTENVAKEDTCLLYAKSSKGGTDNDTPTGAEADPLYRITVRVDGPRNTVSYSQVLTRSFVKPL